MFPKPRGFVGGPSDSTEEDVWDARLRRQAPARLTCERRPVPLISFTRPSEGDEDRGS